MLYFRFSRSFKRDFDALPKIHKEQVERALDLMNENWRYPGLHIKKVQGHPGVWEARISQSNRLTFHFEGKFNGLDVCVLRRVGTHAIFKKP